jgi:hypothetical protein
MHYRRTVIYHVFILLAQPSEHPSHVPAVILPPTATMFLSCVCKLLGSVIDECWKSLKDTIWYDDAFSREKEDVETMFQRYGEDMGYRTCATTM